MKNNLYASQKSQTEDNLQLQTISRYGNMQEPDQAEDSWSWMVPLGITKSNVNAYGHLC